MRLVFLSCLTLWIVSEPCLAADRGPVPRLAEGSGETIYTCTDFSDWPAGCKSVITSDNGKPFQWLVCGAGIAPGPTCELVQGGSPAPSASSPPVLLQPAVRREVSADGDILIIETKGGNVVIKLRPDLAPKHVERVKQLAKEGFYDGNKFHRVIPGFIAQTGDPTGTGNVGSKYSNLPPEFSQEPFKRGTVAAARSADPTSANSQFFICFSDFLCAGLTGQYTVWGEVTEGMGIIDKLAAGEPPPAPDMIQRVYVQAGPGQSIAQQPAPPPPSLPPSAAPPPAAIMAEDEPLSEIPPSGTLTGQELEQRLDAVKRRRAKLAKELSQIDPKRLAEIMGAHNAQSDPDLDRCSSGKGKFDAQNIVAACTRFLDRYPNVPSDVRAISLYHRAISFAFEDFAKAKADLDEAIKLATKDERRYLILVKRAHLFILHWRDQSAAEDLNAAIALAPRYSDAYYVRALLYEVQGRFDAARADYRKILESVPESERSNERAAGFLAKHDDAKFVDALRGTAAFDCLMAAYAAPPDHEETIGSCTRLLGWGSTTGSWRASMLLHRTQAYFSTNQMEAGQADLDEVGRIGIPPALEPKFYLVRAGGRYQKQEFAGVVDDCNSYFAKVTAEDRMGEELCLRYRAAAFLHLNQHARALEDTRKLLARVPNDEGIKTTVKELEARGPFTEACSNDKLTHEPDGCIRAATSWSKSVSGQQLGQTLAVRGWALLLKNRNEEALSDFAEATRLAPQEGTAFAGYCAVLRFLNKPADDLFAACDRAIQLGQRSSREYFFRGTAVVLQRGELNRAMGDLDMAISLQPDLADAYLIRGQLHAAAGHRDQAIADYRETMRLNPSQSKAKELLDQLGAAP